MFLWGRFWGEIGPPCIRSWKPGLGISRAKGLLPIIGGAIIVGGHMEAELVGKWFEPSTITSLMPLWLAAVLIADGDEPSIAQSFGPPKDICCSKPFIQSKFSSKPCPTERSLYAWRYGDCASSAMD